MVVSLISRSDENRFKELNDDLQRSANRGRGEYPVTLMNVFNLLARDSGEYDTVRVYNLRFRRPRGGRGGRCRYRFLFVKGGQAGGGCSSEFMYSRVNDNNVTEVFTGKNRQTFLQV